MILRKLQMRDFRCYSGAITIDFSTDHKRNTTVIQGTNGAGKTSILQALNFVLYGLSAVTAEPDSPLINNELLRRAREDSPARAKVTLDFSDSQNHYQLSRTIRGFLVAGKVRYLPQQADELRLTFTKPDGNTERDKFPQQSIEHMLPSPIRTFFFFDGDRIADFTKPGRDRDEKINKAVNDVLHMEALSRAAARTGKIASDKNKALEKAGAPSVQKTALRYIASGCRNRKTPRICKKSVLEIGRLTNRCNSIDEELISINEVAKLAQERKQLENQHSTLVERKKQLTQQLVQATLSAVPSLMNHQIASASDILSKYKNRHEIPARIADYFLRELLHSRSCICGRSIDEHSPEELELETLLKSLVPNTLQDKATDLASRLRPLQTDASARAAEVVRVLKLIEQSNAETSRIDQEIERIGGDIDAQAFDRSMMLNRERSTITRSLMELKGQVGVAERNVEIALNTKTALIKRQESELQKQQELRELNREWVIARKCSEALHQAKSILEERLRATLGSEATEILRNLASADKKYFFSEVKVDPNFLLRVIDHNGRDVRPQLSMGETQVSSLAFMLAMTRLGGQEAPLVVDTPLARLDKSVRANTAHWLPKLTHQLVLLVTDAEFTPDVEEQLAPSLGLHMRLSPTPQGTQIEVRAHA